MSYSMSSVSDIKLIRTDTTLDLSQKAEKRCRIWLGLQGAFIILGLRHVGDGLGFRPFCLLRSHVMISHERSAITYEQYSLDTASLRVQ